jgi:hypothetical protein
MGNAGYRSLEGPSLATPNQQRKVIIPTEIKIESNTDIQSGILVKVRKYPKQIAEHTTTAPITSGCSNRRNPDGKSLPQCLHFLAFFETSP